MGKPAADPARTWSAWADRAIERGRDEARRCAAFLTDADPAHADLKGVSPEQRRALIDRLTAASKGS